MLCDFNKDKVTLVKADGTVAKENVAALVTGDMIFTADNQLPVEVGDYLLRDLHSGLVEKYEVKNPKYYDVGHGARTSRLTWHELAINKHRQRWCRVSPTISQARILA